MSLSHKVTDLHVKIVGLLINFAVAAFFSCKEPRFEVLWSALEALQTAARRP